MPNAVRHLRGGAKPESLRRINRWVFTCRDVRAVLARSASNPSRTAHETVGTPVECRLPSDDLKRTFSAR